MGFKHLTAAKQNRIFVVDPEMICSPTPVSFASGMKYLLPLIHPEIVAYQY
jgi:iron complex transport system substrate-binding protein